MHAVTYRCPDTKDNEEPLNHKEKGKRKEKELNARASKEDRKYAVEYILRHEKTPQNSCYEVCCYGYCKEINTIKRTKHIPKQFRNAYQRHARAQPPR